VGYKEVAVRAENIEAKLEETYEKLRTLVDTYIPYTIRGISLQTAKTAKIDKGTLDIIAEKPIEVPFFFAPSLLWFYNFEIYKKPLELEAMHFLITKGAVQEVLIDWNNIREYDVWRNVSATWGMFLLFSKSLLKQDWLSKVTVKTSHRELSEFLTELVNTALDLEKIRQFKMLMKHPKNLLSKSFTTAVEVKIWYPEEDVKLLHLMLGWLLLNIDVVFENEGRAEISCTLGGKPQWMVKGEAKNRALEYLEEVNIGKIIDNDVKKAIEEFLEAYAKTLFTMKLLNL